MNRGVKLNISGDGYDGTSKRKSVKRTGILYIKTRVIDCPEERYSQ